MGEEIPGLNDGVGLVPQGRLGTGIANVFDSDKIAQSLYRLGGRMENLEKLKLASAAKIAAAKAKEKEDALTKIKDFTLTPYGGNQFFNVGQELSGKVAEAGMQQYDAARKAGDAQKANQTIASTDWGVKNINAKVSALDKDYTDFWAGDRGKFFIQNPDVDLQVKTKIPKSPDKLDQFFQFNVPGALTEEYVGNTKTYDYNAAGDYALKEAGKTTVDKRFTDGTSQAMTSASSLFNLPINAKGKVDFSKNLVIDYEVAYKMFANNEITKRQMQKFGVDAITDARTSDEYKKLTTPEEKKQFESKAYEAGVNQYIDKALAGKGDKNLKQDLEQTYRRNAQTIRHKEVKEKPTPSVISFNAINRFQAPSKNNPSAKMRFADEVNFGPINYYQLDKSVDLIGTQVYPTIDPEILTRLGVVSSRIDNGKKYYTLNIPLQTQNAAYIPRIDVNQTNRIIIKQGDKSKTEYFHPKGVVLNSGKFAPSTNDDKKSGFVVSDKIQFNYNKLTPADKAYLEDAGYTETDLRQGFINAPLIIDDGIAGGATLSGEIQSKYREQAPQRESFMGETK